jgi:hypothetical protein
MKMLNMKTLRGCSVLLTCLLPAIALPETGHRQQLEGSWNLTIAFDGTPPPGFPATFPVMHTFIPSGEVIETASLLAEKGAGHGEWAQVAPYQFRYTLRFFALDPTGKVAGIATVRHWVQVDQTNTKLEACRFIGDINDFSGKLLLHSTGSCTGSRISIDLDEPAAVIR